MLSLATDGSEDDLHGSKHLKNAIAAAKEPLVLGETNEIEFFSNMVPEHGKIEKEVEAGDIFIPEQEEKPPSLVQRNRRLHRLLSADSTEKVCLKLVNCWKQQVVALE